MNTRIIAQAAMHAAAVAGVLMVCAPAAINGAPQAPAGRQGSQNDPNQKEWIQLFNGRDLTGWTPKFAHHDLGENVNNTFRVEDGMLKVRYDKWPTFADQFGHLFYREPFSYYILAAEYRFVGEQVKTARTDLGWAIRNNGLMIHSPDPKTMLKDQDFPISIEVQLLGGAGDGKPRTTANLCTPGTNIVMDGKLRTAALHQLEVQDVRRRSVGARRGAGPRRRADTPHGRRGDGAGVPKPQIGGGAASPTDPAVKVDGTPLTGGFISLQAETAPIDFRKVELLNLEGCTDPKASNYKTYFVKANAAKCRY